MAVAGEEVEGAPWALAGQGWAGIPQRVRTSGGCRGNQGSTSWYHDTKAGLSACWVHGLGGQVALPRVPVVDGETEANTG